MTKFGKNYDSRAEFTLAQIRETMRESKNNKASLYIDQMVADITGVVGFTKMLASTKDEGAKLTLITGHLMGPQGKSLLNMFHPSMIKCRTEIIKLLSEASSFNLSNISLKKYQSYLYTIRVYNDIIKIMRSECIPSSELQAVGKKHKSIKTYLRENIYENDLYTDSNEYNNLYFNEFIDSFNTDIFDSMSQSEAYLREQLLPKQEGKKKKKKKLPNGDLGELNVTLESEDPQDILRDGNIFEDGDFGYSNGDQGSIQVGEYKNPTDNLDDFRAKIVESVIVKDNPTLTISKKSNLDIVLDNSTSNIVDETHNIETDVSPIPLITPDKVRSRIASGKEDQQEVPPLSNLINSLPTLEETNIQEDELIDISTHQVPYTIESAVADHIRYFSDAKLMSSLKTFMRIGGREFVKTQADLQGCIAYISPTHGGAYKYLITADYQCSHPDLINISTLYRRVFMEVGDLRDDLRLEDTDVGCVISVDKPSVENISITELIDLYNLKDNSDTNLHACTITRLAAGYTQCLLIEAIESMGHDIDIFRCVDIETGQIRFMLNANPEVISELNLDGENKELPTFKSLVKDIFRNIDYFPALEPECIIVDSNTFANIEYLPTTHLTGIKHLQKILESDLEGVDSIECNVKSITLPSKHIELKYDYHFISKLDYSLDRLEEISAVINRKLMAAVSLITDAYIITTEVEYVKI